MADPVRIGVVGAGTISQRGILPHLTQADVADRVRVQAVCDPFPGRAEEVARRFGVPRSYPDYDDLLALGEVDAVTIASPIGLHYSQVRDALAAGKHVHVNKTMTTTVTEATELIDLAEERGLKVVASPGEVLRPQNQYIKRLIETGEIGTVTWAICGAAFGTYHEREPERHTADPAAAIDPSWYFRTPGGGPLYDMVVYGLHSLTTVLGPVRRVTALSGLRITEREFQGRRVACEADDNTLMLLDFGANLFAVAYGAAAGSLTYGAYGSYFGTRGSIVGLTLNGEPLTYPGHELVADAPGWTGEQWVLPHVTGPHREIEEQHVFEDIMQLVDWIRDDVPTPVTVERARHVVDIIESAYRSAASGETVALETTTETAERPSSRDRVR